MLSEDAPSTSSVVRTRVHISGLVQGVGFRPFVWREATSRELTGWVGNDPTGVVIEVEGDAVAVAAFLDALNSPPSLARVDQIRTDTVALTGDTRFEVRVSETDGARRALISPDTATCDDCLRELRDPADRRFGYPFINCTACGPRYTIVQAVPYDRSRTTMAAFPMCGPCQAEYDDPADRRFHAEPTCCPACGPRLRLVSSDGIEIPGNPIDATLELLRQAQVVAVKGLGGYHLAVDARQEAAVAALRARKHREDRPFALMVRDLDAARELCKIDADEVKLLTSAARPIVILPRHEGTQVAPSVAPGSPSLGLMLPYTPLHSLLLDGFDGPVVLTSGNVSDEPIAFRDDDAGERLAHIADAFLVHDRAIRTRVDDSVVKVVRERLVPIRRSRGYVPSPILLPQATDEVVLACGAALKNTFCVARGQQAFVSHHVGDLDEYATMLAYVDGIDHLTQLLDVDPRIVAHDLHPDYPSTRYAEDLPDVQLIGVQHHHAHIASCLADNGVDARVIGVAFDGVGFGADGTAWGGEFLIADLTSFDRVGHLAHIAMPGGDGAVRQPWRMAAAHVDAAYGGAPPPGLAVMDRNRTRWDHVLAAARAGINAPVTSSVGRLFDAVSALLGVRDVVTYEGQAAIDLENVADPQETGTYLMSVSDDHVAVVSAAELVRALVEDLQAGTPVPVLAARFHNAVADAVLEMCSRLREQHHLSTVALSGGVFQNALLVSRCLDRLHAAGFTVLTHRQVPPNDGGISLGQSAVAVAQLGQASG